MPKTIAAKNLLTRFSTRRWSCSVFALTQCCLFVLLILGSTGVSFAQDTPASSPDDRLRYINILQGTDSTSGFSHGNTLPLTGMPWGMIDWCIQSEPRGIFKPNGKFVGFRATHEPSPWMGDYGQFLLMPQAGKLEMDPQARRCGYDQTKAVLQPDYENITFGADPISAELTATERCAAFRLMFHNGTTGRLIFNAFGNSEIRIEGRTIRGITRSNHGGVSANFASYFVIELDRDVHQCDTFVKDKSTGSPSVSGPDVAAYVEFKTSPMQPVNFTVGNSYISWEQAEQNMRSEASGGFDAVHGRVQQAWNHNLGSIDIQATEDQKKTFYSCLYRADVSAATPRTQCSRESNSL